MTIISAAIVDHPINCDPIWQILTGRWCREAYEGLLANPAVPPLATAVSLRVVNWWTLALVDSAVSVLRSEAKGGLGDWVVVNP